MSRAGQQAPGNERSRAWLDPQLQEPAPCTTIRTVPEVTRATAQARSKRAPTGGSPAPTATADTITCHPEPRAQKWPSFLTHRWTTTSARRAIDRRAGKESVLWISYWAGAGDR